MASDPKSTTDTSDNATAQATSPRAEEATEAVGEVMRQGQDAVLRSMEMGSELLSRLSPFALLTAGDRGETRPGQARPGATAFPAAAWTDGLFELVETALAVQRSYVDQLLAAQRQLVGQVLHTGTRIASAGQAEFARQSVSTLESARASRN